MFRKAYEIFLHSIIYDKELAWGCDLCPKPLSSRSSNFAENDIKGFEEDVDSTKYVKGIEANRNPEGDDRAGWPNDLNEMEEAKSARQNSGQRQREHMQKKH